jgi:hypothetical protein
MELKTKLIIASISSAVMCIQRPLAHCLGGLESVSPAQENRSLTVHVGSISDTHGGGSF